MQVQHFKKRIENFSPLRALRSSLSLRTAVAITAAALIVLVVFSLFVTSRLTAAVFESRRVTVLEDAAIRYSQAHATMEQSTALSPDQVQEAARLLVENIQNSASSSGAVAVALLRAPEASPTFRINEIVPPNAAELITPELRSFVQSSSTAQWQSVALEGNDPKNSGWTLTGNTRTPALVTGTTVHLPRAGRHELYIVYSLATDQAMVSTTMNVLLAATLPILFVLPFIVFWGSYRLLGPVQRTARAASSLAQGNLDVRVPVEGTDEMAELGAAFNDMARSLQTQITEYDELSQLQQRFVSDVSHELRTPLTTIRMAEEMIWDEREELSPVGKRSAELLHGQVARFESMLADLLEISRLDAQSAALEAESVDLRPIVAKVVEATQELAHRQNVDVSIVSVEQRLSAAIDSRRIERVIQNLVVNAIEHAEQQPVVITLDGNERCVALRVRDWGVGMDDETAARVFDRFFRADPARARTTGGTGLGLAIAREDVLLHGGFLGVRGKPGRGASFLLCLPRVLGEEVGLEDSPLVLWEETAP